MTAASHARGDGVAETYGAGRCLGFGRGNDLEHVGPVEVLIGVDSLSAIIARWRDYEAIIGMNKPDDATLALHWERDSRGRSCYKPGLIHSMIAGTSAPSRMTAGSSMVVLVVSRRSRVV